MDEDVIDDIAYAFNQQFAAIFNLGGPELKHYEESIYKCVVAVGIVINSHLPTYDMRYFYKNCGLIQPYPVHDIQA